MAQGTLGAPLKLGFNGEMPAGLAHERPPSRRYNLPTRNETKRMSGEGAKVTRPEPERIDLSLAYRRKLLVLLPSLFTRYVGELFWSNRCVSPCSLL